MRKIWVLAAFAGLLALSATAGANTVASSTMWFQGTLTDQGGVYSGTLAMVDESALGIGDGIAGFDIYAKNGAWATYDLAGSGSQNYTSGQVVQHDAYTTAGGWGAIYTPDCGDWYNYQLNLTAGTWAVEYNGNVGNDGILTGATCAPMSGAMNWATGYAAETGTGAYYPATGTAESPGYAASFAAGKGQSTVGAWDMDWSWGSDYVPLEYPGFAVGVTQVSTGEYLVSLTPVPEPISMLLFGGSVLGGLGAWRRRRGL